MDDDVYKELIAFVKSECARARREALEEAAGLRFTLRIPTPETGPFTVQQMAIDDYSDAIKALANSTPGD